LASIDRLSFNDFVAGLSSKGSFEGAIDPIDGSVLTHPMAGDAVYSSYRAWQRLERAATAGDFADAMIDLTGAMDSLVTWLPGYDYETGELEDISG
jgi:hypothetical protein